MITQTEDTNPMRAESEETAIRDMYLERSESFWWPYRAMAKALLRTQDNSLAYLEANRRLIDAMRNILRREQDLAFEISEAVLNASCQTPSREAHEKQVPDGRVDEVFDRAMTGIRELGEAWIDVQVRSLDTIRSSREPAPEAREEETSTPPQAEAA